MNSFAVFNEDGDDQENNGDADERQLFLKATLLVMVVMFVLVMVLVGATITMIVMMFM